MTDDELVEQDEYTQYLQANHSSKMTPSITLKCEVSSLGTNKVYHADCMVLLKQIANESIDLIICDLPYGKTNLEWDKPLNLQELTEEYRRIVKKSGVIVLTGVQPFTSELIAVMKDIFKYEIIWEKSRISNPLTNKFQPSRVHENILIFSKSKGKYNPIKFKIDEKYRDKRKAINNSTWNKGQFSGTMERKEDTGIREPQSVIFFPSHWSKDMHPTQKPLSLFKYLIETYSDKGDLVLDNCIGSGTTALACKELGRDFIGMELDEHWHKICIEVLSDKNSPIPPNAKASGILGGDL